MTDTTKKCCRTCSGLWFRPTLNEKFYCRSAPGIFPFLKCLEALAEPAKETGCPGWSERSDALDPLESPFGGGRGHKVFEKKKR